MREAAPWVQTKKYEAGQEASAVENTMLAGRRGENRHRYRTYSEHTTLRQLTCPGLSASGPSPDQKPQWKAISLPRIPVNLFCPLILPSFLLSKKLCPWTQLKWESSLSKWSPGHIRDAWMITTHQSLGMWCLLTFCRALSYSLKCGPHCEQMENSFTSLLFSTHTFPQKSYSWDQAFFLGGGHKDKTQVHQN